MREKDTDEIYSRIANEKKRISKYAAFDVGRLIRLWYDR